MINVKIDNKNIERALNNAVDYSVGFLDGINMSRIDFNRILGGYTAEALGKYIDSKARMNTESLHHVYEWNKTGIESARLFSFNVNANVNSIVLSGKFLVSKSSPDSSDNVFSNKAQIMENKIAVTVEPKESSVLSFEDDGETIFTVNSVYIANPGGDKVAGSFGRVVDEFFDSYFTRSVFQGILKDLSTPKEFSQYFSEGSKSGRSVGVRAGRKYFKMRGLETE